MTRHIPWILTALVGAVSLAVVAVSRGETVNALWIVVAAVSCFLVAYRYYALFIASEVMRLDPARPTPAIRRADGLDYVATDRTVLFGHHFAAIAGAGPLVGPVLAAQMGYLPGTLWIIAGVVLAGAVQDFMVLFISMRRDGKSLGELIRMEMGQVAGTIALFGAFMIMVIILAVLALIVVKALAESPWGMFTVAATVPLAMAMGAYTRWIRPGRIGEVSILGLIGLLAAIVYGQAIAQSPVWGPIFTFTPVQLCWILIGYGAVASVLPVWLLLAPRDYLSTFLKIGAIAALAIDDLSLDADWDLVSPFAQGGKKVTAPAPLESNLSDLPEVFELDDARHAQSPFAASMLVEESDEHWEAADFDALLDEPSSDPRDALLSDLDALAADRDDLAKLNQALAYIEQGSLESACDILNDVINNGDDEHKQEARELLARIA